MKILACAGAITDYLDCQPYAKKLIASFDRQFLLYEATVLSFTIATIGRGSSESNSALVELVKELASGKLPHEVENASRLAQRYAKRSAELIERVRLEGKKMRNFAYFLTNESATGNVANFLVGAFNIPVGAAIREEEPGYLEISLRSSEESKHDLGKIVSRIALKLNTSGGGHPRASGARIREGQLKEFLQMLDEELSKPAA
jgi:RecJ-like exonuclease